MSEEDELRDLEAVKNVRETNSIGMIISDILCLFLLHKNCLNYLPPFPSPY